MGTGRSIIEVQGVTKRFGDSVIAVDDVSLEIGEGEFFALLGPSGCGKTTLLRMIAGFETPSEGAILIDGQDMSHVAPNRRPVNMVFQSYAVFPHMSVFDNVGYGLKVEGVARAEIAGRVEEALALVKLGGLGGRKPDQLSGGQRQRVALARALVKRPKVLLLDEPLSALDAKLREEMQLELMHLRETVGITFIIVTHDQAEALCMARRVAVMEAGKVRQVAPPADLYDRPVSRFVADFIGKMNLFEGSVAGLESDQSLIDVAGLGQLRLPAGRLSQGQVGIAVRPERVRLDTEPPREGDIRLRGTVTEIAYYGHSSFVYVTDDGGRIVHAALQNRQSADSTALAVGDDVWCSWAPGDTLVLTD